MKTNKNLTRKTQIELLNHMERVDVLWMKLGFELDILTQVSPLSRKDLMIYCDQHGYHHVAEALTATASAT